MGQAVDGGGAHNEGFERVEAMGGAISRPVSILFWLRPFLVNKHPQPTVLYEKTNMENRRHQLRPLPHGRSFTLCS